jgi:hypothetical protein
MDLPIFGGSSAGSGSVSGRNCASGIAAKTRKAEAGRGAGSFWKEYDGKKSGAWLKWVEDQRVRGKNGKAGGVTAKRVNSRRNNSNTLAKPTSGTWKENYGEKGGMQVKYIKSIGYDK